MELKLDGATDPGIRALLRWWETHRQGALPPLRAAFNPEDFVALLPRLCLIGVQCIGVQGEAQPAGARFRYRVTGTEIDATLGVNLTGMRLEDTPFGDEIAAIQQQYQTAVTQQRPVLCHHRAIVAGRRYVEYDRLALPLADDDRTRVSALLCLLDFKCAYSVSQGPGADCPGVRNCDMQRRGFCLFS